MPSKEDPVTRARIARIATHTGRQDVEDYIKRVVDEAPPLTSEQRDRLTVLLRSGK